MTTDIWPKLKVGEETVERAYLYTHTLKRRVEITNCVRNGRSTMKSRKVQTKLIDPNFPRPIPIRYCTRSYTPLHTHETNKKTTTAIHSCCFLIRTKLKKATSTKCYVYAYDADNCIYRGLTLVSGEELAIYLYRQTPNDVRINTDEPIPKEGECVLRGGGGSCAGSEGVSSCSCVRRKERIAFSSIQIKWNAMVA